MEYCHFYQFMSSAVTDVVIMSTSSVYQGRQFRRNNISVSMNGCCNVSNTSNMTETYSNPYIWGFAFHVFVDEILWNLAQSWNIRNAKVHWLELSESSRPYHESDSTRASWRLKSPVTLLFVQRFSKVNHKEHIKAPHYWSLVKRIDQWPMDSPHKGQQCGKVFMVWRSSRWF